MKLDFHPASDAAMYVLFDPTAVPQLIQGKFGPFPGLGEFVEAIDRESVLGNILVYFDNGDGDPNVRIYVDEPPEDRLIQFAERTLQDSLLRVPSGRLFCMGGEYIGPEDSQQATPQSYRPPQGYLGSETTIPPGTYRLTGFDLDALRGAFEDKVREGMGDLARTYDAINNRTGFSCLATVGTIITGLLAALIAYIVDGWPSFFVFVALLAIVLALLWLWIIRGWYSDEVKRALKRRHEVEAEWPSIVIVLSRVADDVPLKDFRPARMGPNAAAPLVHFDS